MTEHAENDAQFTFQERLHIAMALAEGGWNQPDAKPLTAVTEEQRPREERLSALSLFCSLDSLGDRVGHGALSAWKSTQLSGDGTAWIRDILSAVSQFARLADCSRDIAERAVETVIEIGTFVESLSFGEKRGGEASRNDLNELRELLDDVLALRGKMNALSPRARLLLDGYLEQDHILFAHFFSSQQQQNPLAQPLAEALERADASRSYGEGKLYWQLMSPRREFGALLQLELVESRSVDLHELLASDWRELGPERVRALTHLVRQRLAERVAILSGEHFGLFRLVDSALDTLCVGTSLALDHLRQPLAEQRAAVEDVFSAYRLEGGALGYASEVSEYHSLRSRLAAPSTRAALAVVAADAILVECAKSCGAKRPSADARDELCDTLRQCIVDVGISQPVKGARRQLKKFGFDFRAVALVSVRQFERNRNRTLSGSKRNS